MIISRGSADTRKRPANTAVLEAGQWRADLLEAHADDGFATLAVEVPWCGGDTSLNALDFDRPCGFARFEIAVWNPDRSEFDDEDLTTLAGVLGHPVRQIRAHA